MGDDNIQRQILAELQKQTRILKEIKEGVEATTSAVWDTSTV